LDVGKVLLPKDRPGFTSFNGWRSASERGADGFKDFLIGGKSQQAFFGDHFVADMNGKFALIPARGFHFRSQFILN
jgi:hypothetical protein